MDLVCCYHTIVARHFGRIQRNRNSCLFKRGGNTEFYFLRHTGFLLIGLALLYLTHHIPFQYYSRLSQIMLLISIGLLLLTLFIGTEINNATRVIPIPLLGITFQPSDLAKLSLVMYISRYLSKNQEDIDTPKSFGQHSYTY